MSKAAKTIKPKERDTIIQALSAGVVPRLGLAHIQVGRAAEIGALLRDVDRIADGGAAVRFVIGEYGAGKTFFANLIRLIALERKCVGTPLGFALVVLRRRVLPFYGLRSHAVSANDRCWRKAVSRNKAPYAPFLNDRTSGRIRLRS